MNALYVSTFSLVLLSTTICYSAQPSEQPTTRWKYSFPLITGVTTGISKLFSTATPPQKSLSKSTSGDDWACVDLDKHGVISETSMPRPSSKDDLNITTLTKIPSAERISDEDSSTCSSKSLLPKPKTSAIVTTTEDAFTVTHSPLQPNRKSYEALSDTSAGEFPQVTVISSQVRLSPTQSLSVQSLIAAVIAEGQDGTATKSSDTSMVDIKQVIPLQHQTTQPSSLVQDSTIRSLISSAIANRKQLAAANSTTTPAPSSSESHRRSYGSLQPIAGEKRLGDSRLSTTSPSSNQSHKPTSAIQSMSIEKDRDKVITPPIQTNKLWTVTDFLMTNCCSCLGCIPTHDKKKIDR